MQDRILRMGPERLELSTIPAYEAVALPLSYRPKYPSGESNPDYNVL